jgi:hypothetical protein
MMSEKRLTFNLEELGLILKALKEYEENHYEYFDDKEQCFINNLIEDIENKLECDEE